LKQGWTLPDTWDGFAQLGPETLPLPTKHLTAGQVLAFRDRAFTEYFSDPAYLAMIRRKFGPQVEAHIHQMLAKRIRRKHAEGAQVQ
jgi:hypothetical protein